MLIRERCQGLPSWADRNGHGLWQYTIDNGITWASIGTTGSVNARLLAADPDTRVRFVPIPGSRAR